MCVLPARVAEDDVFIGPNAVLTNDLRPRSKVYHATVTRTLLKPVGRDVARLPVR